MQAFRQKHVNEVGDDLALMGWPDDGNGRYIVNQGYSYWYFFAIM